MPKLVRIAAMALLVGACSGGGETAPKTGSLQVTVVGDASGPVDILVTGPNGYQHTVRQTESLTDLASGTYRLQAFSVISDSETYAPVVPSNNIQVKAGTPATITIFYRLSTGSIAVTVTGLPAGVAPRVLVGDSLITRSRTVHGLSGSTPVTGLFVSQGTTTFGATPHQTVLAVAPSLTPIPASVAYSAMTDTLQISVDSIPGVVAPKLMVTGPFGFSHAVAKFGATTYPDLPLGVYTLTGQPVASATDSFAPNWLPDSITLDSQARLFGVGVGYSALNVSLNVIVNGLPGGANGSVNVTGPNGFNHNFTATATLHFLAPATYNITAASVTASGVPYYPSITSAAITCPASTTPCSKAVAYTGFDLAINGMQLTQATQRFDGSVPLVAGRDAMFRVFPSANLAVGTNANVRVRWYQGASLVHTDTIFNVPMMPFDSSELASIGGSPHLLVPGSRIQPGMSVLADVDPGNAVHEVSESNNSFPANGTPFAVNVQNADSAHITLVPVSIPVSGATGNVGNGLALLTFANKIHPIPGIVLTVHKTYTSTSSQVLQATDANGEWEEILTEVDALRTADNAPASEIYFGVVHPGYPGGVAGLGYIGYPVAIGWDRSIAEEVLAHEIGHTWGQYHAPCGNPSGVDPNYPYSNGSIGVYGWDPGGTDSIFVPSSTYDVMSYCQPYWTSDYTWDSVMSFRAQNGYDIVRSQNDVAQPALMIWGHEVNGRLTLEPAFEVTTRAQRPEGRGAYALEGLDERGGRVFAYSFTPHAIADGRPGSKSFVFAIPLSEIDPSRLAELRVTGRGAPVSVKRTDAASRGRPPSLLKARSARGGTSLTWDAASYPMALVRDAETGKVLSFARGGAVVVAARGQRLEVTLSDGVRSVTESVMAQ